MHAGRHGPDYFEDPGVRHRRAAATRFDAATRRIHDGNSPYFAAIGVAPERAIKARATPRNNPQVAGRVPATFGRAQALATSALLATVQYADCLLIVHGVIFFSSHCYPKGIDDIGLW